MHFRPLAGARAVGCDRVDVFSFPGGLGHHYSLDFSFGYEAAGVDSDQEN